MKSDNKLIENLPDKHIDTKWDKLYDRLEPYLFLMAFLAIALSAS